jgi:hypothetical protein
MNTIAVPSHVTWEIGQIVYARWRWEKDKPRHDPEAWYYEPWWIVKIGPKRLLVEDAFGDDTGYVDRRFLEAHGWGIAYGPWQTFKAAIHAEWHEEYIRYRLYYDDKRRGKRLTAETLGGQMRLDRRIDALRVLGLPVTADDETIKRTYRRKAMELHPDRGGDAEAFIRLQAAYENVTREWNPSLWELIREVERRVRQKQAPPQENARP